MNIASLKLIPEQLIKQETTQTTLLIFMKTEQPLRFRCIFYLQYIQEGINKNPLRGCVCVKCLMYILLPSNSVES